VNTERIRPLSRDEVPLEVQRIFDKDEEIYGLVLNTTRVQAYRPSILAASKALSRSVNVDPVLPRDLKALVCTLVASLVGCPF
jgi:hypothetical protein